MERGLDCPPYTDLTLRFLRSAFTEWCGETVKFVRVGGEPSPVWGVSPCSLAWTSLFFDALAFRCFLAEFEVRISGISSEASTEAAQTVFRMVISAKFGKCFYATLVGTMAVRAASVSNTSYCI